MTSPVALVTGASSGIGRALSLELAEAGHDLVLAARRQDDLDALSGEIQDRFHRRTFVRPVDLSNLEDVEALVPDALEALGRLDVLVNNGAHFEKSPLHEMPVSLLERTLVTNVISPTVLVREAWEALSSVDRGVVINLASVSILGPLPTLGAYCISKCGMAGLTLAIQAEAGDSGIIALAIAPGAVDTAMLQKVISKEDIPGGAMVPMEQVTGLILECINGEHDDHAGGVLFCPVQGVVTRDHEQASLAIQDAWDA